MTKKWNKTGAGNYTLTIDDEIIGQIKINHNSINSKATLKIADHEYSMKRTGIWKSSIEITDKGGNVILSSKNEKWYANSSLVEYNNKSYKLILRNNPLAEYVLFENNKELLSYSLVVNKKESGVRITSSSDNHNILLDFFIWYLFAPIVAEHNSDETILFLMLTA